MRVVALGVLLCRFVSCPALGVAPRLDAEKKDAQKRLPEARACWDAIHQAEYVLRCARVAPYCSPGRVSPPLRRPVAPPPPLVYV